MGADNVIHICDPASEGSDPLATAKLLSAALRDILFDIILAGHRGVDEDRCQVGQLLQSI